jgi:AcrR family transcriptional regulator
VPRLWEASVDAHRESVRAAAVATAAELATRHGIRAVTMSAIAREAGISRATLYRYFADVDSILMAWHEHHVGEHLGALSRMASGPQPAGKRLRAVLEALTAFELSRPGGEVAERLHASTHVSQASARVDVLLAALLRDCAEEGAIRGDVAPAELALYCRHSLRAARHLSSRAAVQRLHTVICCGLALEA